MVHTKHPAVPAASHGLLHPPGISDALSLPRICQGLLVPCPFTFF